MCESSRLCTSPRAWCLLEDMPLQSHSVRTLAPGLILSDRVRSHGSLCVTNSSFCQAIAKEVAGESRALDAWWKERQQQLQQQQQQLAALGGA